MKRIISLLLIISVITVSCMMLSGCEQTRIKIMSVTISSADTESDDPNYMVLVHHRVVAECEVREDLTNLRTKYIFSKNGESYYLECSEASVDKGSIYAFYRDLTMPVYSQESVKNLDSTHPDLILTDGDILDTLGKGTKVTVEIYCSGEKIAEKSTKY